MGPSRKFGGRFQGGDHYCRRRLQEVRTPSGYAARRSGQGQSKRVCPQIADLVYPRQASWNLAESKSRSSVALSAPS